MTRAEHLDWSKKRALKYLETGDTTGAYASFMSDIGKHSELEHHPGRELGMGLLMLGKLNEKEEMRKFIEGFN
jgi:hypothetical protein